MRSSGLERMVYMDRVKLQQLSGWMGFVGIITIIGGVLSAIAGVFAFVVGAIPGIIAIILGIKLRSAKQYADAMLAETVSEEYSANFNQFVGNLSSYFKIQGILIIVSLILGLLAALLSILAFIPYRVETFF
ncbi:MAG: DUF5362 family protein [Bacillota bacterium]|nr:DUF5362 family protein [Bacillota bacterium]